MKHGWKHRFTQERPEASAYGSLISIMLRILGITVSFGLLLLISSVGVTAMAAPSGPHTDDRANPHGLQAAMKAELDRAGLLEASLIASGLDDPDQRRAWQKRWQQHTERIRHAMTEQSDAAEPGNVLLGLLHTTVLGGEYDAGCTEVHQSLKTGDFNCVTATVLFVCLCRENGLQVQVVSAPGHVYCRMATDPPVDVQTTAPNGYGAPPEAELVSLGHERFVTRFAGGNRQASRVLSDAELLGKIYYNRGVSDLEQAAFASAADLLQTSVRLDAKDEMARENLLAGLNNWALAVSDEGDFQQATRLLRQGLDLDASHEPLLDNDLHVHSQWVAQLCRQHHYAAAIDVLDAAQQRRPDAVLFSQGQLTVYRLWLDHLTRTQSHRQAEQVLAAAKERFPEIADR